MPITRINGRVHQPFYQNDDARPRLYRTASGREFRVGDVVVRLPRLSAATSDTGVIERLHVGGADVFFPKALLDWPRPYVAWCSYGTLYPAGEQASLWSLDASRAATARAQSLAAGAEPLPAGPFVVGDRVRSTPEAEKRLSECFPPNVSDGRFEGPVLEIADDQIRIQACGWAGWFHFRNFDLCEAFSFPNNLRPNECSEPKPKASGSRCPRCGGPAYEGLLSLSCERAGGCRTAEERVQVRIAAGEQRRAIMGADLAGHRETLWYLRFDDDRPGSCRVRVFGKMVPYPSRGHAEAAWYEAALAQERAR